MHVCGTCVWYMCVVHVCGTCAPQEKTLEALIVARETFPEKWIEDERKRIERHASRVEEALK